MGSLKFKFKSTLPQLVSTENGREARTQCKEYGVNRYVFLAIAMYAMLTLGRFMWAFPSFYAMLLRSGAYAWLCDDSTREFISEAGEQITKCAAQDVAISNLYPIVVGSTLFGSIFAAGSNVSIGAKLTSMFGSTTMLMGMLMIGFSREELNMFVPGAILLGMGMDFVVFPSLNVVELFPGRQLLVTSIIGASISVGMYIPPIMNYIMYSRKAKLSTILLAYSLATAGILIVVFMLYYPPKRFYNQKELDDGYFLSSMEQQLEEKEKENEEKTCRESLLIMFGIKGNKIQIIKRSILSYHFLLLTLIFALVMTASVFYITTTNLVLNEEERNYLAIGIATSFVVCIGMSPVIDKLGSMWIMWFEAGCLLLSVGLIFIDRPGTRIASVVFFSLFTSFYNGQIWIFTVETFDAGINTLILGLLNLVGGIVTFIFPIFSGELIKSPIVVKAALPFIGAIVLVHIVGIFLLHMVKLREHKIE